MKYTDEQKTVLAICRKYKGVRVHFQGSHIIVSTAEYSADCPLISNVEAFLDEYATLKQVGRPKGSTKPSRKVKRDISLSADQWSKVEEIRRQQGLKYTSHAIGLAVEAFSETDEAYKKGYSDGYSEGYDQGYEDC